MKLRSIEVTFTALADWPYDETPARDRQRSPFSGSWSSTLDIFDRELFSLGAKRVSIELVTGEAAIRRDGQLRADAKVYHPGAAIRFVSRHGEMMFHTDVFASAGSEAWRGNLRAIALGMESLRRVDRYGIGGGRQYRDYLAIETAPADEYATRARAREVLVQMWDDGHEHATPIPSDHELYRYARVIGHPDKHGGTRVLWDAAEAAAKTLGVL